MTLTHMKISTPYFLVCAFKKAIENFEVHVDIRKGTLRLG